MNRPNANRQNPENGGAAILLGAAALVGAGFLLYKMFGGSANEPQVKESVYESVYESDDDSDDELHLELGDEGHELDTYYDKGIWNKLREANDSDNWEADKKFNEHISQQPNRSVIAHLPSYLGSFREDEPSDTFYCDSCFNPNGKVKRKLLFLKYTLTLLVMPPKFVNSICVQMNNCNRGLLHGYLRHRTELEALIPGLSFLREVLCSPFRSGALSKLLDRVDGKQKPGFHKADQNTLLRLWRNFLQNVERHQQEDLIENLVQIQRELEKFLLRVMTVEKYIGNTFNTFGNPQILFRIDATRILVLGVSKELYSGNGRPVREIITLFIVKNDEKNDKTKGARKLFG